MTRGEATAEPRKRTFRQQLKSREQVELSDPARVATLSQAILKQFRQLHFPTGAVVALYRALPGELILDSLVCEFHAQGIRTVYPRIADTTADAAAAGQMEMHEIKIYPFTSQASEWAPVVPRGPGASFGIAQPSASAQRIDSSEITTIFVPGLAFSREGHRLGRGKGYYDRYLAQAPQAVRVALAPGFRLFDRAADHWSVESWDQPLDWVVTEHEALRLPHRASVGESSK